MSHWVKCIDEYGRELTIDDNYFVDEYFEIHSVIDGSDQDLVEILNNESFVWNDYVNYIIDTLNDSNGVKFNFIKQNKYLLKTYCLKDLLERIKVFNDIHRSVSYYSFKYIFRKEKYLIDFYTKIFNINTFLPYIKYMKTQPNFFEFEGKYIVI